MKTARPMCALIALVTLWGCGAGSGGSASEPPASAASSSNTNASANASKYDSGPRAIEQSVDEALAESGEHLFKDKGCSACHAFGAKLSGPDLVNVTQRRTAQWMEQQILHPEVMVKEDPISRQLMATHMLQMPNQGLKPEEARSIIEYLKHRDQEASESAAEAAEDGAKKEGEGS